MRAEKTRKKLHDWSNMMFTNKYAADAIKNVLDELEIIEEKSSKWYEKETPYKPTGIKPIGMSKIGFCKCSGEVLMDENYCSSCGQRLCWEVSE